MAYTLSSEFPEDRWSTEPPIQARTQPTDRRIEQPSQAVADLDPAPSAFGAASVTYKFCLLALP